MVRVIPMAVGPTAVSGVIGTDTAMGGGDFTIPVWAKSVLGMSLGITQDEPVAAQTIIARANLTSNMCPIQPYEAIAAPIGSCIAAAVDGAFIAKNEKYDMNMRVSGGEAITPNIRTVTTGTLPYGVMSFLISDAHPTEAQRHIRCGTATLAAVTNNNENNGTAYAVSGAKNIVELLGVDAQITLAVAAGYISRMRFQSAEFAGVNTADLIMAPHGGVITAGALFQEHIDGVSRQKCSIPVQPVSQCNIQDSYRFLSSANLAVAPNFLSGVVYDI